MSCKTGHLNVNGSVDCQDRVCNDKIADHKSAQEVKGFAIGCCTHVNVQKLFGKLCWRESKEKFDDDVQTNENIQKVIDNLESILATTASKKLDCLTILLKKFLLC